MGVVSDGSYGITKGLIYSYPVKVCARTLDILWLLQLVWTAPSYVLDRHTNDAPTHTSMFYCADRGRRHSNDHSGPDDQPLRAGEADAYGERAARGARYCRGHLRRVDVIYETLLVQSKWRFATWTHRVDFYMLSLLRLTLACCIIALTRFVENFIYHLPFL